MFNFYQFLYYFKKIFLFQFILLNVNWYLLGRNLFQIFNKNDKFIKISMNLLKKDN